MELNEKRLREFDLNGLLTLLVIYREECVTQAALRMGVKKPAVSNTLAKLRSHFNDPLFIRHSRGVTPTAKASRVAQHLEVAFAEIQKALAIK